MRRTFPKEMVHVTKLIKGTLGFHPALTWLHEYDELDQQEKRKYAEKMVELEKEEEEEGFESEGAIIKWSFGMCALYF